VTDPPAGSVIQLFFVVANRGGERVAAQLDRGLTARGWRVSSVGIYRATEPNEDSRSFTVLAPRRPGPIGVVAAWWRLWRLFRRMRPDAVLLHTQIAGLLGATAATAARVPRRVIIHHIDVGVRGRAFRPADALMGWLGFYTSIVFVGRTIRDDVSSFPRRYQRRVQVIPNAVETPPPVDHAALRRRYGIAERETALLAVGALTEQKNHDVVIRAVAGLTDVVLLVAGDGPRRAELESLAAEVGAPVRVLGQIPPADVRALYGAVDLFVLPSRSEGRSLALLDAVAAGLPVLLSDIGQNREVMGDAAAYCPPQDTSCWSRAVHTLCTDLAAREALRDACQARDIGSPDAMVDAYVALITASP
jgi:glycosyltransferase involved in cell wall biosynthesis